MKTAVSSVIYDAAIDFFPDFIESLNKQTVEDFTLFLINDNISKEKLERLSAQIPSNLYNRTKIIDKCDLKLSIPDLRVEMIKTVFELDYDLLIMLDCDDVASWDRVESICNEFEAKYGFFYNQLQDFDGKTCMPDLPEYTLRYEDIGEWNYLGMSNGAINLKHLTSDFIDSLKEAQTNVFDWYLYSRLLLKGEKGKRINGGITFYRIYESNLAGICNYDQESKKKEIEVKKQHYKLLSRYAEYYSKLFDLYNCGKVAETGIVENGYWWSLTRGWKN